MATRRSGRKGPPATAGLVYPREDGSEENLQPKRGREAEQGVPEGEVLVRGQHPLRCHRRGHGMNRGTRLWYARYASPNVRSIRRSSRNVAR